MNRKAIGSGFSKLTALGFLLFSGLLSVPIFIFLFNLPPLHEKETWKAMGGFLFLSALVAYCAYTGWTEFFPQHKFKTKESKEGIWGLLLLPPIGLAIGAYQSVATIYSTWTSETYSLPFALYNTFASGIVGLAAIGLLVPFFKKDKRVPLMMISFYLFLIFIGIINILVILIAQPLTEGQGVSLFFIFLKQCVTSMVWIIYFMSSDRVKRTFTKKGVDQGAGINSVTSLRDSTT